MRDNIEVLENENPRDRGGRGPDDPHGLERYVDALRHFRDYIEKRRILEARPIYGIMAGFAAIYLGYVGTLLIPTVLAILPAPVKAVAIWILTALVENLGFVGAIAAVVLVSAAASYLLRPIEE